MGYLEIAMPNLIVHRKSTVKGTISKLPSSKSISNRALIMDALSGKRSTITNLASARDTKLMTALLASNEKVLDAMDAGTTMRFLTAYLAIGTQRRVITGTARMKERPIGILVEALRQVGAQINFLEKEGYPPLEINPFPGQKSASISLPGNVSSQYISAMMMIGPVLPNGITINMEGKIGSRPYIEMTAALMKKFGVSCQFEGQCISIEPSGYRPASLKVEPDWSALSYWFAIVALASEGEVALKDVASESMQGDRVIVDIMDKLGVDSRFSNGDLFLSKKAVETKELNWDFTNCPDLAQTVLPVCALKGVRGKFTGLESLFIKETDRIAALQAELAKVNAALKETSKGVFELSPGKVPPGKIQIQTYHDHRMAMGFAPWATLFELEIEAPEVVRKSYPEFWDDLRKVGFSTKEV